MPLTRAQIFDVLSIATIAAAIGVSAWRSSTVPPAPFTMPANSSAGGPGDSVTAALNNAASTATANDSSSVVNANIFSVTRRAPRVRYVSPDAIVSDPTPALSQTTDVGADTAVTDSSLAANSDSVPRLYGIVSQDGVRHALLRLSAGELSPRLFVEGDRHSGWQVMRIDFDRVTIRGASGQRVLRLSAQQPSDSSGKRI